MIAVNYAQGLVCHANYWVKCPAGEFGQWTPDWQHIGLSALIGLVLVYLIMKFFGIKL